VEALKTPLTVSETSESGHEEGTEFSRLTSGVRTRQKRSRLAVSGGDMQAAMAIIRSYSLLQRKTEEQMVRVHRLVQAVIRDALDERVQEVWISRIIRAVDRCFPEANFETWGQCERYLPHALACHEWIVKRQLPGSVGAALLHRAAKYLSNRAQHAEAEPLYMRALAIREQQLGPQHPDTALNLNDLALLYKAQGKYAEAEPLFVRALAIREQQLGPQHPDTAQSLNDLAALYQDQGKYAEAEPLYVRALAIREQQLGPQHPNTASSLDHLATLYESQGKDAEAEPLFVRALAIREQKLGAEHPDTASSLDHLAALYESQGKDAEAEPLFVRALAIREQKLGAEHPDTQIVRANYTALLEKMKLNENPHSE
jgi:tetratricopeptide (TPR) repeat protein